jgi:uncharacterized glyoxalase superfamily protein PhnB
MMVEDVGRTIAFYCGVLGFEVVTTAPGPEAPAWALLKRGRAELMFQAQESLAGLLPPGLRFPRPLALTICVDVDDVEALYRQVAAAVPVVHVLADTAWGTREFSIRDCNGFVVTFAEALPAARQAA